MSHTEIGWIVLTIAVVGSLIGAIPVAEPFDIIAWPPQPEPQPEEIGSTDVDAIDKPSEDPHGATAEASGACAGGSCGTQRRGVFGIFRRR